MSHNEKIRISVGVTSIVYKGFTVGAHILHKVTYSQIHANSKNNKISLRFITCILIHEMAYESVLFILFKCSNVKDPF